MGFKNFSKGLVAAAVALSTSTAAFAKDAEDVTIGFLQLTLNAPYYVAMWAEAERLAEEKGFNLIANQADRDAVKQIQQLEDMVARGVDAIVVNAADPVVAKDSFVEAIQGGMPIIFIDSEIPGAGAVATFKSDNEKIGVLAGELAAKRLGAGPIKMGILLGGPGDVVVGPARERGFLQGLENGGTEYEIVIRGQAEYAQDLAVPATEDMITAHPDLDLIFAYNDGMALGALEVVKGSDTMVAAIDGQKEALAEIAKGCDAQYLSTGLNSPMLAARGGFNMALAIGLGELEPTGEQTVTFTKAAGIGCENVGDFYNADAEF